MIFTSLAFGKRVWEFQRLRASNGKWVPGRGYQMVDIEAVRAVGVASGLAAVVVFCLYLNSELVSRLYRQWELLWLLVPVMLATGLRVSGYWTTRGAVQEDPVLFAAKDRVTYLVAGFAGLVMLLATHQWFPHLELVH